MAATNENEIKVMLNEQDYIKILNLSQQSCGGKVIQTNYYFDTKEHSLSRNKVTLRVREIGSKYNLTIKIKDKEKTNDKLTVSDEHDFLIDQDTFYGLVKNKYDLLTEKSEVLEILNRWVDKNEKIIYIGKLVTDRIKFRPIQELPQAELDKNAYLGHTDYELEWETKNPNEIRIIEEWLTGLGIPFDNNNKSKYGRFIEKILSS
jgi:uncharacterized protein YjbK